MTGASTNAGDVAAGEAKEDLTELSCEELRVRLELQMQRLEVQNCDMSDLRKLVAPFKVENTQLARSLKKSQQQIQQVFNALRELFRDPTRREWLESHKEDRPLCTFFAILIKWYKKIKEDEDPTIRFYEKVWQYERGDPLDDVAVSSVQPADQQAAAPEQPDGFCYYFDREVPAARRCWRLRRHGGSTGTQKFSADKHCSLQCMQRKD